MQRVESTTAIRLTSPRAAAVAGIIFSLLFIVSLVLIRLTVPLELRDPGTWVEDNAASVNAALYLLPFVGIAFLWFIGVLRERMGQYEDRFFETVFLGSGLLFMGMLFVAGGVSAGVLFTHSADMLDMELYTFGRVIVYKIVHIYAMKMAAVFMVSTSTVAIRTRIFPRWMAWLGYLLALLLLLSPGFMYWTPLLFPLWVLLISSYILLANIRRP